MKKYIGGYSILDLNDENVSVQANVCYNQDKPVLVYGENGERYFADTITKDGTNVVITKGGKTITIANDNTLTNVGDIQNHLLIIKFDYDFGIEGKNAETIIAKIPFNKTTITIEELVSNQHNMFELYDYSSDYPLCLSFETLVGNAKAYYYDSNSQQYESPINDIDENSISNLSVLKVIY